MPSLLSQEQRSTMSKYDQLIEAFKASDTDGSGTISKRELINVLKKVGVVDTRSSLQLFEGFDANGDGELSFEEFQHIAKTVLLTHEGEEATREQTKQKTRKLSKTKSAASILTEEQRSSMSKYEQMMEAFRASDTDGSGTISRRELLAVLKKVGVSDTKSAMQMFNGFDVNGDGELSVDEFKHIAKTILT